jgi:hypothetical protein
LPFSIIPSNSTSLLPELCDTFTVPSQWIRSGVP